MCLGEIEHALSLSKPKIVFASSSTIDRIVNIAKRNSFIKNIMVFGNASNYAHVQNFYSFINDPTIDTNLNTFKSAAHSIATKPTLILCSSGTTGLPKGVKLSERNVMVSQAQHL